MQSSEFDLSSLKNAFQDGARRKMVPCHLLYTGKGTPLEPSEQARNQITYTAMLLTQLPTCLLVDTFTDQLLLSMLIDSLIITLLGILVLTCIYI